MRVCAGNGSIEKFINQAKTIEDNYNIHIISEIITLGDELLLLQDEFIISQDTKELYEKIVLCNATMNKKGRNSHILINRMNSDTLIKFLKKHLITKINLLSNDPTKLVRVVGSTFTSCVDQLLNILNKINNILPQTFGEHNIDQEVGQEIVSNNNNNIINNNNDKIYYKIMFDVVNNCFYEILEDGIFIIQPERLFEFAEKQKSFFDNKLG